MESIELNQFWEQIKAELIEALPDNAHPWIYPLELSGYDKGEIGKGAERARIREAQLRRSRMDI